MTTLHITPVSDNGKYKLYAEWEDDQYSQVSFANVRPSLEDVKTASEKEVNKNWKGATTISFFWNRRNIRATLDNGRWKWSE